MNAAKRAYLRARELMAVPEKIGELRELLDRLHRSVGRLELAVDRANASRDIKDHEFQVYSQWGEDGIIQYLLRSITIDRPIFVEFGVGNYEESNTRFLLQHSNWSGLVLDASRNDIEAIHRDPIYWKHNLKTECAFITRQNINALISKHGIEGDIGLLSIDIDGNDYWVWEAITVIRPRIVICEYNSFFGPHRAVTIPYNSSFERNAAHYSGGYFGASIAAFQRLGLEKGYSLVGANSNGINAFFVRDDCLGDLAVLSPEQAYVRSSVRDSKDQAGALSFLSFDERCRLIAQLPVVDVETNAVVLVADAMSPSAVATELARTP